MKKLAVVYWSGTGNTEQMANAVLEGAKESGAEAELFTAGEFTEDMVEGFDAFAFGCPAMGAEELEDSEFQPMFDAVLPKLSGKKFALFGSYGWGDGEWMRTWEENCVSAGQNPAVESVMCNEAPDDDGVNTCKALGAELTKE